jgi:hypothetical protein
LRIEDWRLRKNCSLPLRGGAPVPPRFFCFFSIANRQSAIVNRWRECDDNLQGFLWRSLRVRDYNNEAGRGALPDMAKAAKRNYSNCDVFFLTGVFA